MTTNNRFSLYIRQCLIVLAALALAVLVAYVCFSKLLPAQVPHEVVPAPAVPLALEDSLSPGESVVLAEAPASKAAPEAAEVVLQDYIVTAAAGISDEEGAYTSLQVEPGACAQAPALTPTTLVLAAKQEAASLNAHIERHYCLHGTEDTPPAPVQALTGSWRSLGTGMLPDVNSSVRQVSFTDEAGQLYKLVLSAVGYCESAEGGCASALLLEVKRPADAPTSRLYLRRVGVSPLIFNADGG